MTRNALLLLSLCSLGCYEAGQATAPADSRPNEATTRPVSDRYFVTNHTGVVFYTSVAEPRVSDRYFSTNNEGVVFYTSMSSFELTRGETVQPAPEPAPEVVQAVTTFGLRSFAHAISAAPADASPAVCPPNAWRLLALLEGGARGETWEELHALLAYEGDAMEAAGWLVRYLHQPDQDVTADLSLEVVSGVPLLESWTSSLDTQDAHVSQEPGRDGLRLDAHFGLSATWRDPFDASLTRPGRFSAPGGARRVDEMDSGERSLGYVQDGLAQVALVPCGSGRVRVLVALPREGVDLVTLANAAGERWSDWTGAPYRAGRVRLPRFKLETQRDLLEELTALGLSATVSPTGAQLGGISAAPLYLGAAGEEAWLELDEEGARAGAHTWFVLPVGKGGDDAPPPEPFDMRCDRPFLVAVIGSQGLPIMIGAVRTPGAPE